METCKAHPVAHSHNTARATGITGEVRRFHLYALLVLPTRVQPVELLDG